MHPIANAFLQKPRQGSHQSGPQYLLSKLYNMLTPSPKIEEIIAFQRELIIKELWKICQVLEIRDYLALFGPPKQILPKLKT